MAFQSEEGVLQAVHHRKLDPATLSTRLAHHNTVGQQGALFLVVPPLLDNMDKFLELNMDNMDKFSICSNLFTENISFRGFYWNMLFMINCLF